MGQARRRCRSARAGFTLMELMVAVAILIGIMAMVGTIFATASKASGKATASTTLYRHLDQVVSMIADDLAATPNTTVMGIAGKQLLAFETQADFEAENGRPLNMPADFEYLHRADVLMLFTQRDQDPYLFDPGQGNIAPLFASTKQVVYGHADLGRLNLDGTMDTSKIKFLETGGQRVAAKWHLGRRVVHFLEQNQSVPTGATHYLSAMPLGLTNNNRQLTRDEFLFGQADVVWGAWGDANAGFYSLLPSGGLFQYFNSTAIAPYSWWFYTGWTGGQYGIRLAGSSVDSGYLYDGSYWWQWNGGWQRFEYDPTGVRAANEPVTPPPTDPRPSPFYVQQVLNNLPANLFYDASTTYRRTVVDPEPPVGVPNAMAGYFLPGCSDFKVEYTYDDPREMPLVADGNGNLGHPDQVSYDGVNTADGLPDPMPVRWHTVGNGEQIVWSRLSSPTDPTDPRRWPRAIRVTVRAWDPAGRLEEPVIRTIVHTWR